MDWLGTAVAWSALIACIISAVSAIINYRQSSRARHEAQAKEVQAAYERGRASVLEELHEMREDRNYWRNEFVQRVGKGRDSRNGG